MFLRPSVALICLAGLGAAPAVAASASPALLKVISSLDGKTVLPHRIFWLAFMSIPQAQISQVDYLIDGKLCWVGTGNPSTYPGTSSYYSTYSDSGGYLVTSWLTPGLHKFTVRVVALNGQTGSDTVVARVLPAPVPPAALVGSWQRTIKTADAPAPGSPGNPTETYTPDGRTRSPFHANGSRTISPVSSPSVAASTATPVTGSSCSRIGRPASIASIFKEPSQFNRSTRTQTSSAVRGAIGADQVRTTRGQCMEAR